MSFSAAWLRRREAFDAAARDAAAAHLDLAARLGALRPAPGEPWRVIDLGCGTGANLRWLAPRLPGAQQWLLVDHDAGLLAHAHGPAGADLAIVRRRLDLARDLEALPWAAAHLVTGSALLDLVGAAWLQRLVAAAVAAGPALLFALSVDGRHRWSPADPDDAAVGAWFAAHQRRDKGFGPALGPRAGPVLARALRAAGYRVHGARSDWQLAGPQAAPLQRALIDGIAAAACEQAPAAAATVRAWQARRRAWVGRGSLRVGHVDLLALPPR